MFVLSSSVCLIITVIFYKILKNPSKANTSIETKQSQIKVPFNFNKFILIILLVITLVQLTRSILTPFFALFVHNKHRYFDIENWGKNEL